MDMEPAVNACRFDFQDGSCYTGTLQDGAASGHGVYRGSTGRSEYTGSWRKGFEESGVYRWGEGNYYQGEWLQGRRHGLGVEWLRGWLYKGEWTQGFKGRYGVKQNAKSGAKYEGSWNFGAQDGYGVETYADGGTYQGQFLRGMRHGYGVRESVSYDLALRYHRQFNSGPSPRSRLEAPSTSSPEDPALTTRDRRIEEGRSGGFVLEGEAPQSGDRWGKSSLRKALRFIRQKSAGEIDDLDPGSKRSRTQGGSVRSTISTGRKSPRRLFERGEEVRGESDDWGSFVSILGAVFQEDIVERYWGEWKNDRRTGYGVCERSDGIKYEGEWLDNTKHGYGVTTLRDGSKHEGKYKRNVLLTSSVEARTFFTRTIRLKEHTEHSVNEASKAARTATEKAEISNVRTASARVKAEQAQMAAGRAESLAEVASAHAQKCAGNVSQSGVQIFMNQLPDDDFASTTSDVPTAHAQLKTPSKFRDLLRPKVKDANLKRTTIIDPDLSTSRDQNTAKFYSTISGDSSMRNGREISRAHWSGNTSVPRNFDRGSSTGSGLHDGRIGRGILGAPQARLSDELFRNPQNPELGYDGTQKLETEIHPDLSLSSRIAVDERRGMLESVIGVQGSLSTPTQLWNQGNFQTEVNRSTTPMGRRRARAEIGGAIWQLPSLSPVGSSNDAPSTDPRSWERRKSLPSIIKDGVPTTTTKKPELTHSGGVTDLDRNTFVIEDGVRKRVTPVYGPKSPVRSLAVEGRSGLPKLYSIESTDGRPRGSVPDVGAVGDMEVMSREDVYTLSQQRREELMRQRKANETRGGQIVLRLGDVTDWCARRKMLIVVLAVNYALVTVFYNMMQQQNP